MKGRGLSQTLSESGLNWTLCYWIDVVCSESFQGWSWFLFILTGSNWTLDPSHSLPINTNHSKFSVDSPVPCYSFFLSHISIHMLPPTQKNLIFLSLPQFTSLFKSTFMVSEVRFKDLQQLQGQWTNRCLYLQRPLTPLFFYQPWSSEVSLRFWAPSLLAELSDFIWDLFKGSILFGPYLVVFFLITH